MYNLGALLAPQDPAEARRWFERSVVFEDLLRLDQGPHRAVNRLLQLLSCCGRRAPDSAPWRSPHGFGRIRQAHRAWCATNVGGAMSR
jgi:hypothetical protein